MVTKPKKQLLVVDLTVFMYVFIPPLLLLLVTVSETVYISAESLNADAQSASRGEKKGLLGLFNLNQRKSKVRDVC